MNHGIIGLTAFLITLLPGFHQLEEQFIIRQQHDDSCGFASAAAMLSCYWDIPADEAALIAEAVDASEDVSRSISFFTLSRIFQDHAIDAAGFYLEQSELARTCDVFGPIICWEDTEAGHFYLLLDVLQRGGEAVFVTADPRTGIAYLDASAFREKWSGKALITLSLEGKSPGSFRDEAIRQTDAFEQIYRNLPRLQPQL